MGVKAQVLVDVEVKPRTPKKIKDLICEEFNERFIGVKGFDKCALYFEDTICFSHTGLAYAEGLKLPKEATKYLVKAEMRVTYLEQAPSTDFDLIDDDDEDEDDY